MLKAKEKIDSVQSPIYAENGQDVKVKTITLGVVRTFAIFLKLFEKLYSSYNEELQK